MLRWHGVLPRPTKAPAHRSAGKQVLGAAQEAAKKTEKESISLHHWVNRWFTHTRNHTCTSGPLKSGDLQGTSKALHSGEMRRDFGGKKVTKRRWLLSQQSSCEAPRCRTVGLFNTHMVLREDCTREIPILEDRSTSGLGKSPMLGRAGD